MFTGIIEEIGIIKSFTEYLDNAEIIVECHKVLENSQIGDSISIDGVCQTIVEMGSNWFRANVSNETLNVTNFRHFKSGNMVNLERALTLNTRLGGHIVAGHVDCVGKILKLDNQNDFYILEIEIPNDVEKYVVQKGSITINGISLTVANIFGNIIKLAIIPHTFKNTNLSYLKMGDFVNIETDILAKYVEKMLLLKQQDNNSGNISMEFLKENGYV